VGLFPELAEATSRLAKVFDEGLDKSSVDEVAEFEHAVQAVFEKLGVASLEQNLEVDVEEFLQQLAIHSRDFLVVGANLAISEISIDLLPHQFLLQLAIALALSLKLQRVLLTIFLLLLFLLLVLPTLLFLPFVLLAIFILIQMT